MVVFDFFAFLQKKDNIKKITRQFFNTSDFYAFDVAEAQSEWVTP